MTSSRHPDPAQGIFETLLVVRGVPVALGAHLERLEASLEAVYEMGLPVQTPRVIVEHAANLELGRLRLTVVPSGDEGPSASGLEVDAGELDRWPHFPDQPVSLRSHQVSGGLGCHKWADRAALPSARPGDAPLLVDGEDVLEAAWASVFAVRRGALFTPPLDGRILPGVTRATVIELAREAGIDVVESAVTVAQLSESDEVFLTNSIRGIEPAGSIDGAAFAEDRPLTRRFAETLRDRWKSETAARRRPFRIEQMSSA